MPTSLTRAGARATPSTLGVDPEDVLHPRVRDLLHGDVVRVPHESSMQGPLIDSFTVEMWLLTAHRGQLAPDEGRVVNLVGFPGRHPFLGLASDSGCAVIQLKLSNGSWYSYEGTVGRSPSPRAFFSLVARAAA